MRARIAAILAALLAGLGLAVMAAPAASAAPSPWPIVNLDGDEDEDEEEGINEVDEDDVDIALTDAYLDMIGQGTADEELDDPLSRSLKEWRDSQR